MEGEGRGGEDGKGRMEGAVKGEAEEQSTGNSEPWPCCIPASLGSSPASADS